MARPNRLRTAEGAWYNNYAGYKRHSNYYDDRSYQDVVFSERDREREPESGYLPAGNAMTEYERGAGLGGRPPLFDRSQHVVPDSNEYIGRPGAGAGGGGGGGNRPGRAWDPSHETFGYNTDGKRTEWELEWEPPEQFSPRKTTTYDPSFHRPPPSPKKIPPWERDRGGYGTPREDGQGRDRFEVRFEGQSPDSGDGRGLDQMFAKGFDPRLAKVDETRPLVNIHKKQGSGAFLFVRFPLSRGENVFGVAKACIQAKTSDLGGRFVGIARKVFDYGYPPGPDEGCAVFQFPSLKNAEVFFQCDKRIRQPDFPPPQGHAEIFAISLQSDPNTMQTFDTFLLSEISLNDGLGEASLAYYVEHFKEPFARLLEDSQYRALPYAAFSHDLEDRKSLRRHFFGPKVLVTLHLFRHPEHLESVMKDKRYSYLRAIHNSIATEKCSIFTIDRQACP